MDGRSTIVPETSLRIPMPDGAKFPRHDNQTIRLSLDTSAFDAAKEHVLAGIAEIKAALRELSRAEIV
jgi:hypothetical protein